ncbi:hypothetical protein MPPM_3887 [Methylorubrum populi]|uniref:Uncharacterized protein n=1 Tax=Methylorubrum populi TaxID=223967 RepID=A0A169RB31_9HYPH|nr:hypothetical protein [Methylorubrum populi]BAU92492.1 hypothetical protein MPPM_3887 [Methylorubrum populi]
MVITPELLDAMLANGLSREQIVGLMKASVEADQAQEEAKKAARRANQNERQQRRRRLMSHVVTHQTCDNVCDGVTERDTPAPSLDGRPPSPAPQPPTLYPSPAPGSDAAASAVAAAPPVELSVSDRIWTKFPDLLVGMSSKSDRSVRTWIGKLLSKYRAEDVLPALQAAIDARTGDPFGYATRVLNPAPTKQALRARPPSAQDLWAADAFDAYETELRGRDEHRPFDRDGSGSETAGDPGWHPAGAPAHRGGDRLPEQQLGADPRELPPLRLVGGGRAHG